MRRARRGEARGRGGRRGDVGPRQEMGRQGDLPGIAADGGAVFVEDGDLVCELLGVPPGKFQSSAYFAAMRSVRFSPWPPIRKGGRGRCSGFGSQRAFSSW
jgi:hypothetical protein